MKNAANLDWNLINSFSGWLSAVGTILAVVMSLWLALRDSRIRLKVRAGIRKLFFERKVYEKPQREPDFLVISVTNVGRRVATVTGLLWKNQLVPRRYIFQMPGEAPFSAQIPARLNDGDEAEFTIPLQLFMKNAAADFRRLVPRPRTLTIRFFHILVRISTGELIATRPEKELRRWLITFVEGTSVDS